MTNTTRMITAAAACAVLAAPALAHQGHGGDPSGHTHGVAASLGVEVLILALIAVGLLIAIRHRVRRR
jgi:hydrogenase/urease accessory protein HupE